jgi:hypothetical protein
VISEGQALFKMERARDMEQIKKAWGKMERAEHVLDVVLVHLI